MTVLVTGGAGYIGSHVAHALIDEGRKVLIIDNMSTGRMENVPVAAAFERGNVGDIALVRELCQRHGVTAVMHFAGSIVVPESVENPLLYYENNTCVTRNLLEACIDVDIRHLVFSSTAAVYGIPDTVQVNEATPLSPINPYGASKLVIEWILRDLSAASDLRYFALRYFNVCGADAAGRTGQPGGNKATHLIKVACQTALGMRDGMSIFGTDYDTHDGTCVRDYIHVSDLANVHVLALKALEAGGPSRTMNCGYGHGFSVQEVVDAVKKASGVDYPVERVGRRAGDPPALISDPTLVRTELAWEPQFDDLDVIVGSALRWEKELHAV